MTYPWHGWWSQCVLYVPYLTFHWFFSSLNLNDVLILVLDEFRARKIFILVWSNIIWSLQFIWSVPIVCYVSNIYGHIVNAVCEQKATFIPNNSKTRNHFSMQKSFHHFIAYPKHQKISIRLFCNSTSGIMLLHSANIYDFLFRFWLLNHPLQKSYNDTLKCLSINMKYEHYKSYLCHFFRKINLITISNLRPVVRSKALKWVK